ncbi:Uma2 family endonuclease [Virgisporangium aliadipatigenens]|uniref:Uma2 family endonuclease n=1 Tax=Virgisporangium aliadipatigenens TaxID=741659 RepID=UPI0019414FD4|nr:Uma2 family endonuclease [Virgisporangium aliadipatigenens]
MAAPVMTEFDPLRDLAGKWTTDLAEQYLPLPSHPYHTYECVDGRLIMSAAECYENGFAQMRIDRILGEAVEAAGYILLGQVNLTFADNRWIVPDALVIKEPPARGKQRTWIPYMHAVMPIELVSPSSEDRDCIDKPAMCAAAGVPYFMQIQVPKSIGPVRVSVQRLRRRGAPTVIASGRSGDRVTMDEPFSVSFDPERFNAP